MPTIVDGQRVSVSCQNRERDGVCLVEMTPTRVDFAVCVYNIYARERARGKLELFRSAFVFKVHIDDCAPLLSRIICIFREMCIF